MASPDISCAHGYIRSSLCTSWLLEGHAVMADLDRLADGADQELSELSL